MDLTNRIALFSCLLLNFSLYCAAVDTEIVCNVIAQSQDNIMSNPEVCCAISCGVDNLDDDNITMSETILCNNSTNDAGGSGSELDIPCLETESSLSTNTSYNCNCANLTCSPVSNFTITCTADTTSGPPAAITLSPSTSGHPPTTASSSSTSGRPPTTASSSSTSGRPPTTASSSSTSGRLATTVSSSDSLTTASTTVPADDSVSMFDLTSMVLWIILGCLIALIVITLGAIFLVSVAHYRRYKKKKQPTALDILSKWEDTPNESSDIQLVSMKSIEDGEDKDGVTEEKKDGGVEEKETGKEDGQTDKGEIKEVSKEDGVTVGTFGFAAEKVAESTASKPETPTTLTESLEKNTEDQNEKDETAKEGGNEKLVEVTIEKAGEDSATSMGSGEDPAPTATDTTVPAEKEKAQEETKLQPVPIQIPVIGKQIADEKTPDNENVAETKISEQPETLNSPSSSKDVQATDSVSKEPEPAATITKPQTEEVKTVLASDKSPTATGGLSLFTNEDMEKALGVAATKDLGQVESTQL